MKLWFAPRTRAVRIAWLLEELGLEYEIERVEFLPTSDRFFQQATPTGKLPTFEDDGVVLCESGAICEYLVERYGAGRLAPPIGAPERGPYLQWLHYAEGTAFPPVGIVVWLTRYRGDGDAYAELIADARGRAASGFDLLEQELSDGRRWILGDAFSAADVMLGFTLVAARLLEILGPDEPHTLAYVERLGSRPAFQLAATLE